MEFLAKIYLKFIKTFKNFSFWHHVFVVMSDLQHCVCLMCVRHIRHFRISSTAIHVFGQHVPSKTCGRTYLIFDTLNGTI